MSRPVQMRVSYENDAGFLMRLSKAIEKDGDQPNEWRRETLTMIQTLVQNLLEANKRKIAIR